MADFCISHMTAFDWLTSHRTIFASRCSGAIPAILPCRETTSARCERLAALPSHGRHAATQTPSLLLSDSAGRRFCDLADLHVLAARPPDGSLIPLPGEDAGTLCTSPEMTFVQLAQELDLVGAIAAGYALCANYRLDPSERHGLRVRGDEDDVPLTTVGGIKKFIEENPGLRGTRKAARALRYVREGSRSPMESALAMLCLLPTGMGGFALGEVQLNQEVRIFDRLDGCRERRARARIPDITIAAASNRGGRRTLYLDYDPASTHSNRVEEDSERRSQLATLAGTSHLTITDKQLRDFISLSKCMDRARRLLGGRSKPRMVGSRDLPQNAELLEKTWKAQVDLWTRLVYQGEPQIRPREKDSRGKA